MHSIDNLAKRLQPHYSKFDVANRLLFTGHSHQAWPDVTFDAVNDYMTMVATQIDKKWGFAFEKTEQIRDYLRRYYDDPNGLYCREENTHILIVSWLSSLDLISKPKILTTDGEFHSLYRQLRRLDEAGLDVHYLPHQNDNELLEAIRKNADEKTSAIMLSRVYFESSKVNTRLTEIAQIARERGIPLMIDDYHGTNVVPLSIREAKLEDCFILIGGYKYLQWGESNCYLRFPSDCTMRPVITGWFASFATLDQPRNNEPVQFDEGDQRFATGTFDPISQYRAAAVVSFFDEQGLTPDLLRKQYSAQVGLLREKFLSKNFDTEVIRLTHNEPLESTGGFLSLTSPIARELRADLLQREIFTDARDQILRFGPAPYTTTAQIELAIDELERSVKKIQKKV
jgi:selenocysteine lyase/cysteine desulfurase